MGFLKIDVKESFSDILRRKLEHAGPWAAHAVAVQIEKDTEPYVPALTKSLANRTQVVDGSIIYPGPYARYLYEGKVMVYEDPPYLRVRADGKKVKSHYGQKKTATDKDLNIQKSVHEKATDHWFKESKDQNLDKWVEVAEEAIKRELGK